MYTLIKAGLLGLGLAVSTAGLLSPLAQAGDAATQATKEAIEQTTTFKVANMTCALCPITVRKAMEKVDGVKSVAVDLGAKTATVTYNPAIASPTSIGAASTDAGYPAAPAI